MVHSSSANVFKQHDDYKPEGNLLGKKDVSNIRGHIKLSSNQMLNSTGRLKYDVSNVDNKFAYFDKPQEIGKEIIEGIHDL